MNIDLETTQVGYHLPPVVKNITEDIIRNYSGRYLGVFLKTFHTDREMAAGAFFPGLLLQGSQIMNFSAEVLFKVYREHWINNSSLSVKFIKSVFAGDTVTSNAVVIDRKNIEVGKLCLTIKVWTEKESGDIVMAGEAKVLI